MNLPALVLACIFKSKTRHPGGSLLRNNLEALDYSRNNFVFNPGVQSLSILAHYNQVDARVPRRYMRQVAYGPEVGKEFKALPEFHVDTGEPATNRSCHRSLQSNSIALDR